jgi:hypothetical protein
MDLEEWRMNGVNLLKELVKHQDIERDNFDFKSTKLNKLDEVLCAMANTTTGILCLGVDNPTSETNPNSTFRPDGFRKNTKDETLNSINNFVVKVDPIPIVNHCTFDDEAGDSFYVILKVQGLINQRPYMIKGKGQIWVRIGASTMPATRTTIATLFVNQLERRNSVRKLQVHCRLLRSQLIQTAQVIDGVNREYTDIIPPLDLQPFKDAVSSAEWFLSEQNLLGQVNTTGPTVGGLYTNLHEFNALNTTIDIFNNEQMNRGGRYAAFSTVFDRWKTDRNEFKEIVLSLEDIVKRCDKFLQSS